MPACNISTLQQGLTQGLPTKVFWENIEKRNIISNCQTLGLKVLIYKHYLGT